MCGIIARFARPGAPPFDIRAQLQGLRHRGPDAQDALGWNTDAPGVRASQSDISDRQHILGHVRLSIIDLSHAGDQPFVSADGRYAFSYNGEVYNYIELRAELIAAGDTFSTSSDTEVLLKALIRWGPACLDRLEGMFAFILVDRVRNVAWFARDAFGIKPLHILRTPDEVMLCSEIDPLVSRIADTRYRIDGLRRVVRWGSDDGRADTLVEGIERVPAGTFQTLDLTTLELSAPSDYFRLDDIVRQDWSFEDARVALRETFMESVDHHMRSDAPYAFALSGGIDSSAIVCAAHALGRQAVPTFTYSPADRSINERRWAQIVIDHVGADAHFIEPSRESAATRLPFVVRHQGEAFGTLSIFAGNEVYRAVADAGFKVVLNGQGADELLAGYAQYYLPLIAGHVRRGRLDIAMQLASAMRSQLGMSPMVLAKWLGRALLPDGVREQAARRAARTTMPWMKIDGDGQIPSMADIYAEPAARRHLQSALKESMRHSLIALLRYDDRNSMSHSIESRVPFLTPKMARLCLSLPDDFLISRKGVTKHIFREAMRGIVPDAILDRKDKIGFVPDNDNWRPAVTAMLLQEPLTDKFDAAIDRDRFLAMLTSETDGGGQDFNRLWPAANLYLLDRFQRTAR